MAAPVVRPLDLLYAQDQRPLPQIERISARQMPEPYRRLLVHNQDMTSTLQRFFGFQLCVRAVQRRREEDDYLREVVLESLDESTTVEYGAIRILLSQVPAASRRLILEERLPLGQILLDQAVAYSSWPQMFFRVKADSHMQRLLRLNRPDSLFGRRNLLLNGSRRLLAEVVEILPPIDRNLNPVSEPKTTL